MMHSGILGSRFVGGFFAICYVSHCQKSQDYNGQRWPTILGHVRTVCGCVGCIIKFLAAVNISPDKKKSVADVRIT